MFYQMLNNMLYDICGSVAEAEARRQELQRQANQQAVKTLNQCREEQGMGFASVSTTARLQRSIGGKFGVKLHVLYHNM